ncbi:MAG: 4'-phosphopantetheinyl transferase superfamily protein [Pseudomonadota bacterium]
MVSALIDLPDWRLLSSSCLPCLDGVHAVEADYCSYPVVSEDLSRLGVEAPENFARMVARRRSEFLAGRLCAQEALTQAGAPARLQASCKSERAPVWPCGWIGSISHSDGRAVAVVAPEENGRRLGVDTERLLDSALAANLADTLLCAADRVDPELPFATALTIAFSAKESLFKALYPDVRRFFGFDAAAVVFSCAGHCQLQLREDLCERWRRGALIPVHWVLNSDRVYTLVDVD